MEVLFQRRHHVPEFLTGDTQPFLDLFGSHIQSEGFILCMHGIDQRTGQRDTIQKFLHHFVICARLPVMTLQDSVDQVVGHAPLVHDPATDHGMIRTELGRFSGGQFHVVTLVNVEVLVELGVHLIDHQHADILQQTGQEQLLALAQIDGHAEAPAGSGRGQ